MSPPVFRFAPSPNGYLHLGHAYSALTNARLAADARGRLLLRIEDIDGARCTPEFEAAIDEDLKWLGVVWEQPVRRQSEHLNDYRAALARLGAMGLTYPTFESRSEIAGAVAEWQARTKRMWPRDPDGAPRYPGTSRKLPKGEPERLIAAGAPYAVRIDMQAAVERAGPLTWREDGRGQPGEIIAADPLEWGDVILARKDTPNSYHLAVVVDDALQGVTHVVRGRDLYYATAIHRLLQTLLGLPEPAYRHHDLVLDESGHKLSKSTRATSLRELRGQGATPDDIRARLDLA